MRHLEDHIVALILLLQYSSPHLLTQLQLQDKSGIVDTKIVLTMKVLVVLLVLITATLLSGKGD